MREQVLARPSSQGCRTRVTSSLRPCWAPVSLPPVAAVTHAAMNTGVQTPVGVPALGPGGARPQVASRGHRVLLCSAPEGPHLLARHLDSQPLSCPRGDVAPHRARRGPRGRHTPSFKVVPALPLCQRAGTTLARMRLLPQVVSLRKLLFQLGRPLTECELWALSHACLTALRARREHPGAGLSCGSMLAPPRASQGITRPLSGTCGPQGQPGARWLGAHSVPEVLALVLGPKGSGGHRGQVHGSWALRPTTLLSGGSCVDGHSPQQGDVVPKEAEVARGRGHFRHYPGLQLAGQCDRLTALDGNTSWGRTMRAAPQSHDPRAVWGTASSGTPQRGRTRGWAGTLHAPSSSLLSFPFPT